MSKYVPYYFGALLDGVPLMNHLDSLIEGPLLGILLHMYSLALLFEARPLCEPLAVFPKGAKTNLRRALGGYHNIL